MGIDIADNVTEEARVGFWSCSCRSALSLVVFGGVPR